MTCEDALVVQVGDVLRFHGERRRVVRILARGMWPPYFYLEGLQAPVSCLVCGTVAA